MSRVGIAFDHGLVGFTHIHEEHFAVTHPARDLFGGEISHFRWRYVGHGRPLPERQRPFAQSIKACGRRRPEAPCNPGIAARASEAVSYLLPGAGNILPRAKEAVAEWGMLQRKTTTGS